MRKDLQVVDDRQPHTAPPTPAATTNDATACDAARPTASAAIDPVPEIDALERRAWGAFLTRHARVARQLETDLMARSDLPLAEFDVLFQLGMAEGHRLRMNELADRVLLSRAGITRLVDRLVADGLVDRAKCPSDARGAFAVLTERGRLRLQETRPAHFAAVRRYFLESYTPAELETLAELMERTASTD